MIRFCDKEICCVLENELDWQQMLDYFLDWHTEEKIYIIDETGKYVGSVDYNALFGIVPEKEKAVHVESMVLEGNKNICIVKDYLSLDKTIWENGHKYFQKCPFRLLPVLDEEQHLICFAWKQGTSHAG